jgi:acyl-CoA synthetase (AMP-forming)/AMP-acid ligase II
VGHFDEAGYLYVTGRAADMIVSGGMNVYPAEVERVLVGHPAVAAAAVFGVPHERWGESVAAAIVRRPGTTLDEQEIVEFVKQHLASYKKPTVVEFLDELPLNASQKIDKRQLRSRFEKSS